MTLYEAVKARIREDLECCNSVDESLALRDAFAAQLDEWSKRRKAIASHPAYTTLPYVGNLLIGERAANEYFGYSADGRFDYLKSLGG